MKRRAQADGSISATLLEDVRMYAAFAWGLPKFLRGRRLGLDEAREVVRRGVATREANFVRLLDRGVFGYADSPYLPLLRRAGCELGDVRRMVQERGVEGALQELHAAGVYVTIAEFKARKPIVRGDLELPVRTQDFDNPVSSRHFESQTGGSTGSATRIVNDFQHLADTMAVNLVTEVAHGLPGMPTAHWKPLLPGIFRAAQSSQVVRRWFTPMVSRDLGPALKYRLASVYSLAVMRSMGIRIPWPERVPLDEADVVARWAAETAKAEGAALVRTSVSRALRVALAAREAGLDLTGVTFAGGGEPASPAKVEGIVQGGARYVTNYAMHEVGSIGKACARPLDATDVHFCENGLALILAPRRVDGAGSMIDEFCLTTLLPSTPKLMLNVEIDDFGIVETRACGCPLEELGFRRHLRNMQSYSKLTGEGVSVVGTDMVQVLEKDLPARFGGTMLDYQLHEYEDDQGFTRLALLVSPRVDIVDERAVIEVVLNALGRSGPGGDQARTLWRQAGTLQLRRADPVWTAAGKFMPFRRTGSSPVVTAGA